MRKFTNSLKYRTFKFTAQHRVHQSSDTLVTRPTGALDGKVVFWDIRSTVVLYLIHMEMKGKKKK